MDQECTSSCYTVEWSIGEQQPASLPLGTLLGYSEFSYFNILGYSEFMRCLKVEATLLCRFRFASIPNLVSTVSRVAMSRARYVTC